MQHHGFQGTRTKRWRLTEWPPQRTTTVALSHLEL
jgi:hypothetical protein